ncbi:MAG: HesA/MoeB/ThiF family protein [Euryarchaeota archaeon]|nr:HesA/MoeB/ThiF family protein [Euryarchaeota archaeon]
MLPMMDEGQERLRRATVGIMGVGGLGSPAAMYLAAAGVGHLVLADPQTPELSNLNRQILHWTEDVSTTSKVASAARKLRSLNPEVEVAQHPVEVNAENINEVFAGCDMIMDCLDSLPPRMVLNAHAIKTGTPIIHGAVEGWHGQVTVILPGRTPCLACLFPRPATVTRTIPIMGATAGVFGSLQAGEAIKLLTGIGDVLASRMLVGDLQYQYWNVVKIGRAEDCLACSEKI